MYVPAQNFEDKCLPRANLRGLFWVMHKLQMVMHFFPLFHLQFCQMQGPPCKSFWDLLVLGNPRETGQYISGHQQTWLLTQCHSSVWWRVNQSHSESKFCHHGLLWLLGSLAADAALECALYSEWLYNGVISLGWNFSRSVGWRKKKKKKRPNFGGLRTCWMLPWSCAKGKFDGTYSADSLPFFLRA